MLRGIFKTPADLGRLVPSILASFHRSYRESGVKHQTKLSLRSLLFPPLLCPSWGSGPWRCAIVLLFHRGKYVSGITDDLINPPPPPTHSHLPAVANSSSDLRGSSVTVGSSLSASASHLNPPQHDLQHRLTVGLVMPRSSHCSHCTEPRQCLMAQGTQPLTLPSPVWA